MHTKKRGLNSLCSKPAEKKRDQECNFYSTKHPNEVDESDSNSDFVQSNISKKAKTIFRWESLKSTKKKVNETFKEDSGIPKQPKAKPDVKVIFMALFKYACDYIRATVCFVLITMLNQFYTY